MPNPVKIPAWPKGVAGNVWANKLSYGGLYAIEGNTFNFDTGTAVRIFSIPSDTILWAVGLEVATAFNKPGGSIVVLDTEVNLATFAESAIQSTGFVEQLVLKRYTKLAGPGKAQRELQVTVSAGGTTGIGRIWITIKPNRIPMFKDNV